MSATDVVPAQPYVVVPSAGESIWFLGTLMTVKATGDTTGGAFGLIEQELPPGFATPTHIHHDEDEPFYILQGEVTFQCGERTLVAGAGSFVYLPRGIAHGFQVTSETPARLLQFNFPAGVERFFIEAGEPAQDGVQPGPPDFGKMMALAAKYHMEILPPPAHE
ncbi:MAG TPA: quercetin 2,3-dioxygenase [Ktedonobacterales bacterium]